MLEHHPLLPLNAIPATNALSIVSESSAPSAWPFVFHRAMRVLVMPKNKTIDMT